MYTIKRYSDIINATNKLNQLRGMVLEILCTILRSTPFTVLLRHEIRVQVDHPHAEITFWTNFNEVPENICQQLSGL
jgi:hypothetical protein